MNLTFYKGLMSVSGPALSLLLHKRKKKNKEHPTRYVEKKGWATIPRPQGNLIWIHGASVGETMSVLSLIDHLLKQSKDLHILVTSGTLTSSEMMRKHLPERAFHQFLPLDHPKWIENFLNHWDPSLVLWLESELWPNFLSRIKKRKVPLILLNGRMSPRSFKGWSRFPKTSEKLLSYFDKILVQRDEDKKSFGALAGKTQSKNISVTGSIKYAANPLTFSVQELDILKNKTKGRKIILFSSTHEGEEEICIRVHKDLKKTYPDLLTILVPRHPVRADKIEALIKKGKLKSARRSNGESIVKSTDIYLADTLGELGLFYSLSDICVIGGSFTPIGGHNPIEAAQLNCAILYGPHVFNFSQTCDNLEKENAALRCDDINALTQNLRTLLNSKEKVKKLSMNAFKAVEKKSKIIDKILLEISPFTKKILAGKQPPKNQQTKKNKPKGGKS